MSFMGSELREASHLGVRVPSSGATSSLFVMTSFHVIALYIYIYIKQCNEVAKKELDKSFQVGLLSFGAWISGFPGACVACGNRSGTHPYDSVGLGSCDFVLASCTRTCWFLSQIDAAGW